MTDAPEFSSPLPPRGFVFSPLDREHARLISRDTEIADPEELISQGIESYALYRQLSTSSLDQKWTVVGVTLELTAWILVHDTMGERILRTISEPMREQFLGAHPSRIATYLTVSDSAATRRNYRQVVEQLLFLGVPRSGFRSLRSKGVTMGALAAQYRERVNSPKDYRGRVEAKVVDQLPNPVGIEPELAKPPEESEVPISLIASTSASAVEVHEVKSLCASVQDVAGGVALGPGDVRQGIFDSKAGKVVAPPRDVDGDRTARIRWETDDMAHRFASVPLKQRVMVSLMKQADGQILAALPGPLDRVRTKPVTRLVSRPKR